MECLICLQKVPPIESELNPPVEKEGYTIYTCPTCRNIVRVDK